MFYMVLLTLAFCHIAEAATGVPPRRSIVDKIEELQRKNNELSNINRELQVYWKKRTKELEQKISELQEQLRVSQNNANAYQASLTQLQQQVKNTTQVNDQNTKKYSEQMSILNEQLQIKTKKIKILYDEIDALNSKYKTMNQDKIISEQQLKRLEISEANCQKSLKESQEKEAQYSETVAKWRKDYDQLKSQLDTALQINKELREQNAQYE